MRITENGLRVAVRKALVESYQEKSLAQAEAARETMKKMGSVVEKVIRMIDDLKIKLRSDPLTMITRADVDAAIELQNEEGGRSLGTYIGLTHDYKVRSVASEYYRQDLDKISIAISIIAARAVRALQSTEREMILDEVRMLVSKFLPSCIEIEIDTGEYYDMIPPDFEGNVDVTSESSSSLETVEKVLASVLSWMDSSEWSVEELESL